MRIFRGKNDSFQEGKCFIRQQPEIFDILRSGERGAGGEIQLTDAIDKCARENHNVSGYLFDGERYDCGPKIGYLQATVAFGLKNPETKKGFSEFISKLS